MRPDIIGPLINPEHKRYKTNSYNAYQRELREFNCGSTQTDLSNQYAAKYISTTATDASINDEYNSLYTVSLNNTNLENYWLLPTNQLLSYYQQSSSQLHDDRKVLSQTSSDKQQYNQIVTTIELWKRYY